MKRNQPLVTRMVIGMRAWRFFWTQREDYTRLWLAVKIAGIRGWSSFCKNINKLPNSFYFQPIRCQYNLPLDWSQSKSPIGICHTKNNFVNCIFYRSSDTVFVEISSLPTTPRLPSIEDFRDPSRTKPTKACLQELSSKQPISWGSLPGGIINAPPLHSFKRLLDITWQSRIPNCPRKPR